MGFPIPLPQLLHLFEEFILSLREVRTCFLVEHYYGFMVVHVITEFMVWGRDAIVDLDTTLWLSFH